MGITGTVVQDTGRQEFLAGIGQDALYIADMMKSYKTVCDAADKTAELAKKTAKMRDDFFTEKLRVPQFHDAVDRVRDWAAAKRDGDSITVNGKTYTSVKPLFQHEWGVSYEHVRKCCLKLDRLRGLVDGECDTPTQPTTKPTATPAATATETPGTPAMEILSVNGRDPKFTVAMRAKSAIDFAVSLTERLTTGEKDEFIKRVTDGLTDELRGKK